MDSFKKRFFRRIQIFWIHILSMSPTHLLIILFVASFVVIIIAGYFFTTIEINIQYIFSSEDSRNFVIEALKILFGALFAGLAALLVTNVWQQKNLGIELLKELNSEEFLNIRNNISNQKRISRERNIDFENISHWFPHNNSPLIENNSRLVTFDEFKKKHALANMLYYIIRLCNYSKHGMLDIKTVKNIFHTFFAHHEILILEFVTASMKYTNNEFKHGDYNKYPYNIKFWKQRLESVQFFFKLIGLHAELPSSHKYIYFPSMNDCSDQKEPREYASDFIFSIQQQTFDNVSITIENINKRLIDIENKMNSEQKQSLLRKFFY